MKTQIAIVGAGPAGLLLGHGLRQAEITCIVVERTSQARVEARIRAGILEATLTDLLARLGLDTWLKAEGLLHDGLTLVSDGDVIPIDITGPTGKYVTAYGQTEITRDLIAAAPAAGLDIVWDAVGVALHDVDTDHPSLGFTADIAVDRSTAMSSRDATASTVRRAPQLAGRASSAPIRFAGSACSPRRCRVIPRSSVRATTAALRSR